MKKIIIGIISFYQTFISAMIGSLLGSTHCRFEESCSSYTKRMIKEEGVLSGALKGLKRLSKCQPFYKGNLYGNI